MQILRFKDPENTIFTGCDYDGESARLVDGDLFGDFQMTEERRKVDTWLPPIQPSVIFGIGLNYVHHIEEIGLEMPRQPVVFMKNPGAAAAHHQSIVIPLSCQDPPQVDYEAELCVVLKRSVKNVSPKEALDAVLGYTCGNDVSARDWQMNRGGGQWNKGKGFDTFCPFGPWIVTPDELGDPGKLDVECVLNGRTMQKGNTRDLLFSVGELISFLSESATLMPGTLILTGTPSGVGFTRKPPVFLKPGDVLETRIEGIGTLYNTVSAEIV